MTRRKAKRGHCRCLVPGWDTANPRPCPNRACTRFYCSRCGLYLGGWGPVGCVPHGRRCPDYERWIHYDAMWPAESVPRKPGISSQHAHYTTGFGRK
jgi:hypothetical protein